MAYLTINSTFTPYSFDELIKPFAMYDTAYREQEAYLDAARELDNSGGMFNQESTPIAYGMYSTANDSLKAISDELATNGLSSDLKSRLRNTVRDYRSTMKTLNNAQERYYAEQDRRAKLGSDYVFQQENLSVDDFLGGKSPNQRGESLTNITKDIATQFSARAQQITNDTWNRILGSNGKVVGGYYDITSESGLTAAQLDTILNTDDKTWNSIMNNSGISSEQRSILQGFRNTITTKLNNIGYNDYDDYSRGKIDEAIAIGATSALGSTTHKYVQDPSYDPLGWERLKFEKDKYSEALRSQSLELQLKYPQFQFDNNGNVLKNEDGSLKVNDGYFEKSGKWYNSNGQALASNGTDMSPFIGVKYYDKNGKVSFYTNDKDWINKKEGTAVTNISQLSKENITRLALDLGITWNVTDQQVFEEAIRRGWTISVIDKKFDKDKNGNNIPASNQELIVRSTRSYKDSNGVSGDSEDYSGTTSFNPDGAPEGN